jgi:hypothetical protein
LWFARDCDSLQNLRGLIAALRRYFRSAQSSMLTASQAIVAPASTSGGLCVLSRYQFDPANASSPAKLFSFKTLPIMANKATTVPPTRNRINSSVKLYLVI